MIDGLTRTILEQRDNIENQRNRELNSNKEHYIKKLEEENTELKKQLEELIDWLESKNNITLTQHKTIEPVIKVQEVIDKIKEVM